MTHYKNRRARRGFTLIELLVGIVLFAIVGALFTKLLTVQGKFYDRQGMGNAARNVSRASLNRIVSDFRMIEATGGVVAATPTMLTIRIPFAIGVMCGNGIGGTVLTLLPVDSTTYANAPFVGYAWRNYNTGTYAYVENPATKLEGDAVAVAVCTAKNVTTVLWQGPVRVQEFASCSGQARALSHDHRGKRRREFRRAGSTIRQYRELEILHSHGWLCRSDKSAGKSR